jgi:hypothetical protein
VSSIFNINANAKKVGFILFKTIPVDMLAKCEEKNVNNNNFTIVFHDLHMIVNNFTTTRPIWDIKANPSRRQILIPTSHRLGTPVPNRNVDGDWEQKI